MKHHFEKYCKDYENIENYEKAKKDNFEGWHCHHRLETHTPAGEKRIANITQKELIALSMYYNRPAEELIFLTVKEHNNFQEGWHHTEDAKKKITEASKGRRHTEESKRKMSDAKRGKPISEEHKKKISETISKNNIGKHWYNNGNINKFCYECPEGFVSGMLVNNKKPL